MSAIDAAIPHWQRALTSTHGWGLKVSDPAAAKRQLYAARKILATCGFDLSDWSIRTSPADPAGELWLLPKSLAAHHLSLAQLTPSSPAPST
ncbi:hypothetical protein Kuura_048 [Caulobacter phage Kuura]|nr:hypothetical protein Kuura_048 [Caulobacter phage Kuura]